MFEAASYHLRAAGEERLGQHGFELAGDAERGVVAALDDAGDFQAHHAAAVVGLVVGKRHDEHGLAGAQTLGGGADTSLMDDHGGARKELGVRRVLGDAYGVGQGLAELVALVGSDEKDGADAEADGGAGGELVKTACSENGRGAEGEDDGGRTGGEERFEVGGQGGVAGVGIVKAEAGDEGVFRPVLLGDAEDTREEGEDQERRVLGVEEGIFAFGQAELAAQVVDGLGPLAADEAGESLDGASHAGDGFVGAGQAGIHGQDGRVERGEERERREDVAGPGNAGDFSDDWAGVIELAEEQQVGAGGAGCGVEQVVVRLAESGEEEFAEAALGALAHVVDHFRHERVVGIDVGANGVEFEAEGQDFGAEDGRDGQDGDVAAAFELKGDGDEGIDVAKGADIRQNNAQNEDSWAAGGCL